MKVLYLAFTFALLSLSSLANAVDAPFNRSQQLAAEVAKVLCESDGYLGCVTESPDRCKLELGIVAGRCAQLNQDSAAASTEMVTALTQCILTEHATLIGFDSDGLVACLAEPDTRVTP